MEDNDLRSQARAPDASERGVYIISVAAELVGVHPQTLRIYERKGLLRPSRTAGNTRRYSDRDIRRLRTIQRLTQEGVNLAGVRMIVEMENELDRMREDMETLQAEMERLRRRALEEVERARREQRGAIVPLREAIRYRIPVRDRRGGDRREATPSGVAPPVERGKGNVHAAGWPGR